MAKSKKKKKKSEEKETGKKFFSGRSAPVQSAIGGVLIAAVAGSLILAAFGAAGFVGDTAYEILTTGVGEVGYWVLIVGLALTAYGLLKKNVSLPSVTWVHGVSAVVLFLMILALVDIASPEAGGIIGSGIANGVISAFSIYAGTILLETLAIVATLILVDEYVDLTQQISLPGQSVVGWLTGKTSAGSEEDSEATEDAGETADTKETAEKKKEGSESDADPDSTPSEEGGSGASDYNVENYQKSDSPIAAVSSNFDGDYTPPPVSLLSRDTGEPEVGDVKARANLIKRTLENFNIKVEMDEVSIGPTVTRYALKPAEGVRLNKITNLQNNLELNLAAHPVRIEAPIPGKSLVGIEVPNSSKTTVGLAGLLGSKEYQDNDASLLVGLGQGISGNSYFADLNKMPHLLIGGATGAGKSVTVHALINSLLFRNSPKNLKFIMVDPKRVELTLYNGIPHLLTPVITSAKKAILAMKWAAKEMDRRYDILEEHTARDIRSYHDNVLPKLEKQTQEGEQNPDPMPYIVIVIDEMADLMSAYPKELESVIVRIAQMSRAVGIHLILSTQRPDVSVITGLIKANIPARIALQVSSQVDSRTILDSKGAEQLLGAGDMLYQSGDMSKPVRIQSAFISESEVKKVVKHLKDQYEDQLNDTVNLTKDADGDGGKTIFDVAKEVEEEEERDDKYEEALETVIDADKASTSYLQRKLRVGYSRAARIMDELEENGIISEKDGTKARDVLVTRQQLEAARNGEAVTNQPTDAEETDTGEEQQEDEMDERGAETDGQEERADDHNSEDVEREPQ